MLTNRETLFLESIQARESGALERLAAATGGQSLCAVSAGTGPVSPVKYYEGMAAALADARRAVRRLSRLHDASDASRLVIRDIRDRWAEQSRGPGRAGPGWVGYLAGGVDALTQLLDGQPE